jgi:hypothetical protein
MMSRTYEYWKEQEHTEEEDEEMRAEIEHYRQLDRDFQMYLEQIRDKEINELSNFPGETQISEEDLFRDIQEDERDA